MKGKHSFCRTATILILLIGWIDHFSGKYIVCGKLVENNVAWLFCFVCAPGAGIPLSWCQYDMYSIAFNDDPLLEAPHRAKLVATSSYIVTQDAVLQNSLWACKTPMNSSFNNDYSGVLTYNYRTGSIGEHINGSFYSTKARVGTGFMIMTLFTTRT